MGTKTQKLSNVVDQIVEWQSVFTGDGSTGLTAVAGRGYFIDTTSGAVTVTTPASPKQGDKITIVDYAGTFATNNVTINFNGENIFGASNTSTLSTNLQVVDLIYIDSTQGWRTVNQDTTSSIETVSFITATGGTVTTSGDYKIHTFTGDGCFTVSCAGAAYPGAGIVDYLVVAGGGSGAFAGTHYLTGVVAGGGAGGFRESKDSTLSSPHTASPLAATTGITVTTTTYPVTVGAGGGSITPSCGGAMKIGNKGSNSVFSTITSAGGGGGQGGSPDGTDEPRPVAVPACTTGGSGGGGGYVHGPNPPAGPSTGSSGNTPPVSPPQGNPGGNSQPGQDGPTYAAGGGGGAGGAGVNASPGASGAGGNGATTSITGSPTTYAGGGGGGGSPVPISSGSGGPGGGGNGGSPSVTRECGTANTGGGGGAGTPGAVGVPTGNPSGAGGKGIVIIRYKYQ